MDGGNITSSTDVVNQHSDEIAQKSLLERSYYSQYPNSTITAIGDMAGVFNQSQSAKTNLAAAMKKETEILVKAGLKFESIDKIDESIG